MSISEKKKKLPEDLELAEQKYKSKEIGRAHV